MKVTENLQAAILALPMELERIGANITQGLSEFHEGQRITAARYVDVARAPLLWGDKCRLLGWSLRSTGGPAQITLRNGRDDSAEPVALVDLAADASSNQQLAGGSGVAVGEALWLQKTGAGELAGVVYLGVAD